MNSFKKISVLLNIVFCVLSFGLNNMVAQSYITWPDSGAVWGVGMGEQFCSSFFSYTNAGDTIIDTKSYMKIKLFNYTVNGWGCFPNCDTSFDYCGFLREDTITKKVFYRFYNATSDSLLYDYNLKIGDTVKGFITDGCWRVDSIDSILIKNKYHKRWLLNIDGFPCFGPNSTNAIIEGIGSTWGLIEYFLWFEYGSTLYCVRDTNGEIIYHSSGTGDSAWCYVITKDKEVSFFKEKMVKIIPNPSMGSFTISISLEYIPSKIEIYNMLSVCIFKKEVIATVSTINIDDINNGIYFIRILSDNKNINSKIIIQK